MSNQHPSLTVCRVARAAAAVVLAFACAAALAQSDGAGSKLAASDIQAQANGRIELRADTHVPLFAEFDRSPTLTKALAAALQDKGLQVVIDKSAAKAMLTIRGDVVLQGGPVFYKGVKVTMGDATEKTLTAAAASRTVSPAEVGQAATSLALEATALQSAITPFWRGLALSRMADSLGEATGIKGAFNTALTGDPRGICLSRCEDWKKVKQSAYAFVTLTGTEGKQEIRVLASALSETLAPEEVVAEALARAVAAIDIRQQPAKPQ